jgi:hypothetical protein
MGKNEFSSQFNGIRFFVNRNPGDRAIMGTFGKRDIFVGADIVNDKFYVEHFTVHELGHVWDHNCQDCMSIGMETATKGKTDPNGQYMPDGTPPTSYASSNRGEDWAESLTSVIYPDHPYPKPWIDPNGRYSYVKSKLGYPVYKSPTTAWLFDKLVPSAVPTSVPTSVPTPTSPRLKVR